MPFGSSWKGSAKPDVTLVEFFDYACPYCKASNPAVERLIQEDKGLRVVYRELPILGTEQCHRRAAVAGSVENRAFRGFPRHAVEYRPPGARHHRGRRQGRRRCSGTDAGPRHRGRAQAQLPVGRATRRDRDAAVRDRRPRHKLGDHLRRAQEGRRGRPRQGLTPSLARHFAALEPLGNHIPLARILAAGGRLGVLHGREMALQFG